MNETRKSKPRLAAVWFTLRMLEVRLRFLGILVALGLIIGYWDTIQNYWDRWTRPAVTTASNLECGTEFYCPMDPSVVREGLEANGAVPKCPICGMPLSLRKKGAPMVLPPGVVGRVSLSPNRIRMAGIRTSEISLRPLVHTIRTVGNVMYDESRQSQIVSRINGYIEKLFVDKTYTEVKKGDPLAEIYSPDLYAAIQELVVANEIPGSSLGKIARDKIRLLGIEDREIDSMLRGGSSRYCVLMRSPGDGRVIRKMVQQGANVSAGQILFEIADLHHVWVEADVYERDLGMLHEGQVIEASVEAYPGKNFKGKISLIYPELNRATRTNRVRFELENVGQQLRAGMYATVTLSTQVQATEPFHTKLVSTQTANSNPVVALAHQSVCPVTGARLGSMGDPVAVLASGQTIYICCAACENAVKRDPQRYIARIRTVSEDGVLSVPESAVIDTGEHKIVYVERENYVYEGLEVQLGPKSNGYYAVISGLLPGDKVATSGAFLIDAETRLNPSASASYFGASSGPSSGASSNVNSQAMPMPGDVTKLSSDSQVEVTKTKLTADQLAEIGKLSPADQLLAKQQVLCPITIEPLGSMGVPIKIQVGSEAVFVCCTGCASGVNKAPEKMLDLVRRWRMAKH